METELTDLVPCHLCAGAPLHSDFRRLVRTRSMGWHSQSQPSYHPSWPLVFHLLWRKAISQPFLASHLVSPLFPGCSHLPIHNPCHIWVCFFLGVGHISSYCRQIQVECEGVDTLSTWHRLSSTTLGPQGKGQGGTLIGPAHATGSSLSQSRCQGMEGCSWPGLIVCCLCGLGKWATWPPLQTLIESRKGSLPKR